MSDTKTGAAGKARQHETIGGGFFVFRRHRKSGRIHPSQWPFEHASAEAAAVQAKKLADANPGNEFIVVGEILAYAKRGEAEHPTIIIPRRA